MTVTYLTTRVCFDTVIFTNISSIHDEYARTFPDMNIRLQMLPHYSSEVVMISKITRKFQSPHRLLIRDENHL